MLTAGIPDLLHFVGYLTGATLFAMLLVLVVRTHGRTDRFALVTALLGIAWNVGELLVHGARVARMSPADAWFAALAYSALGLLAAVVVHSVSRDGSRDARSAPALGLIVAAVAYGSAGLAAILHLGAAASGAALPSSLALEIVTGGLGALSVPLFVLTRRQDNRRRALWTAALGIFAISALHLGRFHGARESWSVELLGHHASIPLAFGMLYRDYRFALADLFLKQAGTLLVVVATVVVFYAAMSPAIAAGGTAATALLLAGWVATALLYPSLRRAVVRFVDRIVLGRADYGQFVDRLAAGIQESDSPEAVIDRCVRSLGTALAATTVGHEARRVRPSETLPANDVAVWTAEAPQYVIHIGGLEGGRRLLSDDLAMLERVATLAARRIDALRLAQERHRRALHDHEMQTLATEAELRALRAQINPHFLFNALTTIGYLIETAPPRAFDTLMRLTTLLRGVLRSEGEFTTLGRELELIECHLDIERERFEERLTASVEVPAHLHSWSLPPLIVQPLVENAIKHGISRARLGGSVAVTAALEESAPSPLLRITVRNTGAPLASLRDAAGVGLQNVRRRLECCYGERASLTLRAEPDGATLAELLLPAADALRPPVQDRARHRRA